jgi:hypothetical protein
MRWIASSFLAASCFSAVVDVIDGSGINYKPHDPVDVVSNKVGPFNNPSETYEVAFSLIMTSFQINKKRALHPNVIIETKVEVL